MMGGIGKSIHAILCTNRDGYFSIGGVPMYDFSRVSEHILELTKHSVVVMGNGAFILRGKKPYPECFNIVMTEQVEQGIRDNVLYLPNVTDVLDEFGRSPFKNLYVLGGLKTFNLFLPFLDSIDLTIVDDSYVGEKRINLNAVLPMFKEEEALRVDLGTRRDMISGKSFKLTTFWYSRTDARRLY